MNEEFSPGAREEFEARLTALLLGEVTGAEAAALREAIEADPRLKALYERLQKTVVLVRQASATPAQPVTSAAPLKLSEDRRKKLLAQFKTIKPKEFAPPKKKPDWSLSVLQIAAVFAIMVVLAGLLLPSLAKSKSKAVSSSVRSNLKQIELAKQIWADENHKSATDAPTLKDLEPYMGQSRSVAGESYLPGKVGEVARAKMAGPSGKTVTLGVGQLSYNDNVASMPSQTAPISKPVVTALPPQNPISGSQSTLTFVPGQARGGGDRRQQQIYLPPASANAQADQLADGSVQQFSSNSGANRDGSLTELALRSRMDRLEVAGQSSFGNTIVAPPPPITAAPLPPVASGDSKLEGEQNHPMQQSSSFQWSLGSKEISASDGALDHGYVQNQAPPLTTAAPSLQSGTPGTLAGLIAPERLIVVNKSWNRTPKVDKAPQNPEIQKGIKHNSGNLISATPDQTDAPLPKTVTPAPVPQPEVFTTTNAFSTFSLNIADVSFKLAAASLEKGVLPEPASIRSEEFINAFDYRDPEAPAGVPIAFAWERARYPFAQNRDLLRFSLKTAATGRAPGRPLNIVLLLDNSGSMERADRVQIIREALRVLAGQLQPQDTLSIVTFARTARLFVDGVPGSQAKDAVEKVSGLTPQGGTNLEDAMKFAYETALRHYQANGVNRVVLLTDGAANLGNVDPAALRQKVEARRKQGVALDCFGIGWEGYNDDLLEVLARNGDGRYGFLNSVEEAATGFAHQLAGALNVAAADVKVQVEFNPRRVTVYRQIGYAKLQLTKEQFRDNNVDAAEIGAAEAGNALYVLQVDPNGEGPLATVRVRYRIPGTQEFHEHEWAVPYEGNAIALEQTTPALRLAATAGAFSEWLANSPYATEVTPDALLHDLSGVPETFAPDARPKKLEWMIRQAKSLSGK